MHPHTFYATLFEYTKRDEVFVIMSFAPEFDARWQQVIEPTIRDDLKLTPNRVDNNVSGESVVHDILDGIAHAKLVIADITSTQMEDARGTVWPQRNGNVMWELGVAHVMRLPDEVVMVRSDGAPSIFDLTQFRAFQYDPTEVATSRAFLLALAQDRLKSIDQSKSDFVRKCADALDPHSIHYLLTQVPYDGRPFGIDPNYIFPAMQASRLFELGILKPAQFNIAQTANAADKVRMDVRYMITSLGLAVVNLLAQRFPKKGD